MLRLNQIKLPPSAGKEELKKKICRILRIAPEALLSMEIEKKSLDARKKPDLFYSYSVAVRVKGEKEVLKRMKGNQASAFIPAEYRFPEPGDEQLKRRPVIIGSGPAGLFCAYMLALHGYRPLVLERGYDVDTRQKDVERFWKDGVLDPESNVQFGEGGAGTFSDGKLNTLVRDKEGRSRQILSVLVSNGAPEHILYDGKPHIGTDVLRCIVKNMRCKIEELGGRVLFGHRVSDLALSGGRLAALHVTGPGGKETELLTEIAVLAVGHSARDTFQMLLEHAVPMQAKAFAVGFRVEHPQALINFSQYGTAHPEYLSAAAYKLTAQTSSGRGVYSFCMCPGGYVVNASSEPGRLAVNGMSYSKRDGENANSAVIVSVTPEDFGGGGALAGVAFQRVLEENAYMAGRGKIPVQRLGDLKKDILGKGFQAVNTETSFYDSYAPQIKGNYEYTGLREILPRGLNLAFLEGMDQFGKKISGFNDDRVCLSGIESRTSSPVRILRGEDGQSSAAGLYPCGEGAGYAGGIMSAAMDGMRTAERIAAKYALPEGD